MVENHFIVSLDFDGVLAQGHEVKIRYAKEWFGVELGLHQTKKQGFEALMRDFGRDVSYRDLMDPLNEQHIMEYHVPAGCVEVLSRLYHQGCRFPVVTSRNEHDFYYAKQFIADKFSGLIDGIYNTNNRPKDALLVLLDARIHVDDDISKLFGLPESVIPVYLRQPENLHLPSEGHLEVHSFTEIEEIVRGLIANL